jgi:hypothetical protein
MKSRLKPVFMTESPANIRILVATVLGLALAVGLAGPPAADEKAATPPYGEFPSPGAGVQWTGELIDVDPINRRGLLRPGGDVAPDRYNRFLGQPFALLPYGMVYYHGAPAELKDVPLGTVLHGVFYLPPKGDNSVPRPVPKNKVEQQRAAYFVEHTHAILLEDDVSFYRRHGQAWRVERIETSEKDGRQFLVVTSVGKKAPAGLSGEQPFCIDSSSRVWKGKEFAGLADVQPGQTVQVNLTWDPNWGYGKFHVLDLWLDQKALDVAAEAQRQTHIRHQRYHWLPGWVDKVTYDSDKPNGSGTVDVTLFGGMDPTLYAEVTGSQTALIAIAEPTLRTWRKDQDSQGGPLLEVRKLPNPPPGSSGIQIRVQVRQMLEGFRTGGIVRVGVSTFPAGVIPPEERVNGPDDRVRSLSGSAPPQTKE